MNDSSGIERRDFGKGKLDQVPHPDPLKFLNQWYQSAREKGCADAHVMALSTVSIDGQPSSRIVYMRELLEEGIVFYTNYNSLKISEIAKNDRVSLLFYWDCIECQVRVQGTAARLPASVSDAYFADRPRLSQIGAWASEQSTEIKTREELETRVKFFEKKYPAVVPRPPHWGGMIVDPHYFEFWQGRPGRLHDRLCYRRESKGWRIFRLAP